MPVPAAHSPTTAIERLTPRALQAAAQWAAAQHIPLVEANHHEAGSDLWAQFNAAYGACAAATAPTHAGRPRQPCHSRRLEQEAA
ncbi:hypothetical protein [Acidovorax sp. Root219]|uniref:hypothetical protein n=1 Tax=Acidovorax sp. Root219 TaxID=1736493 RepID=UPI00070FE680|nr:hypothetical protein [Acidovorax sp. Root219]KRC18075.1 hypothetical protein ASE28_04655 [Acidovorax sp. Root219]